MPLTRSFNDLIKSRVEADPVFRQALLQEAVQTMLDGDVATARSVLRDFINATIGFERLAAATGTPAKSLSADVRSPGEPNGGKSPWRHRRAAKANRRAPRKWRLSRTRRNEPRIDTIDVLICLLVAAISRHAQLPNGGLSTCALVCRRGPRCRFC